MKIVQEDHNITIAHCSSLWKWIYISCVLSQGTFSWHWTKSIVRCKPTGKLVLTLYLDKTNPYKQGYMYFGQDQPIGTNKDIYSFSSIRTSLPCVNRSNWYRITSYYKKNSSRDLKGRETRKQGTQPQHWFWPAERVQHVGILVPCECLLITGCMAWIACESSFFKLVVFHEPRHHAREAAQFFNNCDILFFVFTDKLHVITSARLFCGLWLLWNTVQTCILNFWPSWSTCGRRLEKLTKKSKSKK